MSRTVAKLIEGLISVSTLPLSQRQKDKTIARVAENLEQKSLSVVQTKHGVLKFHAMRSAYMASCIKRFHDDEPETLGWIDDYIQPGEVLWDIGANVGLYAIYAGQKGAEVLAFEPSGLNFGILTEHIHLNGRGQNVKPLCVALSDKTELGMLNVGDFSVGHASNALGESVTQFESFNPVFSQAIPAFTADDFCNIFKLKGPDHIKLDVDGIEALIIAGAVKTLKSVKTLIIEVEGQNAEQARATIEDPLAQAGLKEDMSFREQGSKRNRLFKRA